MLVLLLACAVPCVVGSSKQCTECVDGAEEVGQVQLLQVGHVQRTAEDTDPEDAAPGYEDGYFLGESVCPYPYETSCGSPLAKYPPYLLGAVYGLHDCAGINQGQQVDIEAARTLGCPIVLDSQGEEVTVAATINQISMMCNPATGVSSNDGTKGHFPSDMVPVHFSWPVKRDNTGGAPSIDWSDFEFTRTDGSKVKPWCATLIPQNDPDEGFTILTVAPHYADQESPDEGGAIGPQLSSLEIVGDLILTNGTHDFNVKGAKWKGGNLDYSLGLVLVDAYVRPFTDAANVGNDPCPEGTTHVVTAATIGGSSRDGVNAFHKNAENPRQKDLFEIYKSGHVKLAPEKILDLADIDGDDITEICLQLDDAEEAGELDTLNMQCDMDNPDLRAALPKGMKNGLFPCTDSQAKKIHAVECPGSSPLCR